MVASGGSLGSGPNLSNAGAVTLSNTAQTVGGLNGAGTLALSGPTALTAGTGVYTGTISGAGGSLTKSTGGTLELTGLNTYGGGTIVSAGLLKVNNTTGSGTGGGAVEVKSGGTLGGTGSITGTIKLNGGSIAPGNSIGTLTGGGLDLETGSLSMDLGAPSTADLIVAPALTINGGSVSLSDAGGLAAGTYTLIDYAGIIGGAGLAALGTPIGPAGFSYALIDNTTNTSVDLTVAVAAGNDKTWTGGASDGNWSTAGNWNTSGQPNAVDATARFLGAAPGAVALDISDKTVGTLLLDSASSYTINGPNALHIAVSTGNGAVTVNNGSHTIAAALSFDNDTDVTVATSNTLTASNLSVATGKNVNKLGGGTFAVNNLRANGLNASNGMVQVISTATGTAVSQEGGSNAATSVLDTDPTIAAGATLDLTNNDLIIRNGNLSATTALIKAGYGSGSWNGTGITSSTANSHSADNTRALGVLAAASGNYTSFAGQTVNGTDVLVKYTYMGDSNLDGKVTFDDFQNFLAGFGTVGGDSWFTGDFNYNGFTTFDDFNLFLGGYGLSNGANGGTLSPADRAEFAAMATAAGEPLVLNSGSATPAPEPCGLGGVLLGATGLLARQRRRPRKMKK